MKYLQSNLIARWHVSEGSINNISFSTDGTFWLLLVEMVIIYLKHIFSFRGKKLDFTLYTSVFFPSLPSPLLPPSHKAMLFSPLLIWTILWRLLKSIWLHKRAINMWWEKLLDVIQDRNHLRIQIKKRKKLGFYKK